MKLTLLTTTIFLPTLLDMLGSIRQFPDQTLCVINRVSQRHVGPVIQQKMANVEAEVRAKYPFIEFPEVTDEATWASINQQFNVGLRQSRNEYVAIAHDDIIYKEGCDYFGALSEALDLIPEGERECGHRIIGLNFSAFEGGAKVVSPAVPEKPQYWQPFPPTTVVVDRRAIFEVGGFDEERGIWYDAHLQHEVLKRGWFLMYVPLPVAHHHSGQSFGITKYPEKFTGCEVKVGYWYGEPKPARSFGVSEGMEKKLRGIVERHSGHESRPL